MKDKVKIKSIDADLVFTEEDIGNLFRGIDKARDF